MKPKFKYKIEKVVNKERAYPSNDLSKLFLSLNQSRKAKTFTFEQIEKIKLISDILNFEIEKE